MNRFSLYPRLVRLDKPIGVLLLLWRDPRRNLAGVGWQAGMVGGGRRHDVDAVMLCYELGFVAC